MADANHPLASRTLCYEVTIKDIRDARPDELNCGYPLRHQGICSGSLGVAEQPLSLECKILLKTPF